MPSLVRLAALGFACLALVLVAGWAATATLAASAPTAAPTATVAASPAPTPPRTLTAPPSGMSTSRLGGPSGGPLVWPPKAVVPARLEAVVYQVAVPADRVAALDGRALEGKSTVKDFEKALAEFGSAKLLYKVDQSVNLAGDRITIGSRLPFITSSMISSSGQPINTIQYQQVGANFHLTPVAADGGAATTVSNAPVVSLSAEIAAINEGTVEIAKGVKAIEISNVTLMQSGPVRYGRPMVAVNLRNTAGGSQPTAMAYVLRYVFSEVKP
jgi:hypothetical protein